ncbi:MAG: LysE family translocator [Rhodospirillales bacterium]|nr:LysE family translocator [Rhodospirillales bacterium]MBO6785869.1 LysE family translocator [Rhodospirillales bacterium]
MLTFITAVFFLIITPGPGVLTVAGVGAAYGFRAGIPYLLGVVIGSLVVMGMVASGFAALVFSVPFVRVILLGASLCYLLYLAWRIATLGSGVAIIETDKPLGFLNGATLSLINPKAYAVFTTVVGGFNFYPENAGIELLMKFLIFASISFPIHFLWNGIGASLKKLPLGPKGQRAINVAMALSMLLVVGLAIYYESVRGG